MARYLTSFPLNTVLECDLSVDRIGGELSLAVLRFGVVDSDLRVDVQSAIGAARRPNDRVEWNSVRNKIVSISRTRERSLSGSLSGAS
jgi:hypothetical protein